MGIGLGLRPRLLEGVAEVRTPKEHGMGDEATNL